MRSIVLRPFLALVAVGSFACASAPKPATEARASPAVAPAAPATAPAQVAAPPAAAIDSGLLFAVEPVEAEIAIDTRPVGTVADLAADRGLLRLAPGIYQVSLKAPGYATWRAEVSLRSGTETLRVKLARKP